MTRDTSNASHSYPPSTIILLSLATSGTHEQKEETDIVIVVMATTVRDVVVSVRLESGMVGQLDELAAEEWTAPLVSNRAGGP